MDKKCRIKKLEKTCEACPAQWEGTLEDGRTIYIRYRWSTLEVRVSKTKTNDIMEAVRGVTIFSEHIGGEEALDGSLELKQLKQITRKVIDWKKSVG